MIKLFKNMEPTRPLFHDTTFLNMLMYLNAYTELYDYTQVLVMVYQQVKLSVSYEIIQKKLLASKFTSFVENMEFVQYLMHDGFCPSWVDEITGDTILLKYLNDNRMLIQYNHLERFCLFGVNVNYCNKSNSVITRLKSLPDLTWRLKYVQLFLRYGLNSSVVRRARFTFYLERELSEYLSASYIVMAIMHSTFRKKSPVSLLSWTLIRELFYFLY